MKYRYNSEQSFPQHGDTYIGLIIKLCINKNGISMFAFIIEKLGDKMYCANVQMSRTLVRDHQNCIPAIDIIEIINTALWLSHAPLRRTLGEPVTTA